MLPSNNHFVLRAVPLPGEAAENPQQILEYAADGKLVRETKIAQLADDASTTARRRTATLGAVWPPILLPLYARGNLDYVFETDCRQLLVAARPIDARIEFAVRRRHAGSLQKVRLRHRENRGLDRDQSVPRAGRGRGDAEPERLAGCTKLCASCGKKRLVGRRECTCCGAPLPSPALDGREIFEPEDAFQAVG